MEKLVIMAETDLKNLLRQSVTEGVEAALARAKNAEAETPFVNKRQAARLLSCSPSTIDNLARAGKLTRHYVGKKGVRFTREEVLALAETTVYYKSNPRTRHDR